MKNWVTKGLKTGIVTTSYPKGKEEAQGITPGIPQGGTETTAAVAERCPTNALNYGEGKMAVDRRRCVHCYRCQNTADALSWEKGFEWATANEKLETLPAQFQHSAHIRVVDAGGCGACLNEVKLLNNPYYNMHRLGFFITPTPRQADILIVVGPVTDHMKIPLLKTYEAMPSPKKVMAVGACGLTGCIFGPTFVTGSGVADIIPVDVEIAGCPPPPLAILHGLLVLTGRKQPASRHCSPKTTGKEGNRE